nr:MAG TPA: 60S ribosome biogenesis protein [Caudoviricetes sp.]
MNRDALKARDFKSLVSTIPPYSHFKILTI